MIIIKRLEAIQKLKSQAEMAAAYDKERLRLHRLDEIAWAKTAKAAIKSAAASASKFSYRQLADVSKYGKFEVQFQRPPECPVSMRARIDRQIAELAITNLVTVNASNQRGSKWVVLHELLIWTPPIEGQYPEC